MQMILFLISTFLFFPLLHGKECTIVLSHPAAYHRDKHAHSKECDQAALQCCEVIKSSLETTYSHVTVVIMPTASKHTDPLRYASCTNALGADLYIMISFVYKKQAELSLFYFSLDAQKNDFKKKKAQGIAFVPLDQAHIPVQTLTQTCINHCYSVLNMYQSLFMCTTPVGFLCKPLLGLQCPALHVQATVLHDDDWRRYAAPTAQAIGGIFEHALLEKVSDVT